MQGVDPDNPYAAVQIFLNLMGMLPWAALFWWTVVFLVVGAVLGWWRGRLWEGVLWAAVLGPIGWVVVLLRPRPNPKAVPPPLPGRR